MNATQELARLLALRAVREADAALLGAYRSRFSGNGLDFSEMADYDGGEARRIHWPLSMRKGRLLVSRYQEERETPMLFGVDASSSMFSSDSAREALLQVTALLSACAFHHNDPMGAWLVASGIDQRLPNGYGMEQATAILHAILDLPRHRQTTRLAALCRRLLQLPIRRTRMVLISDFLDTGYEQSLKTLALKHDLVACMFRHPILSIPTGAELEESESGALLQATGTAQEAVVPGHLLELGIRPVILSPGCDVARTLILALKCPKSG
jgi:uncharacterized protein (DUF58 family)